MQHDASGESPPQAGGRLIYLMGPSGSGKDSIIDQARPALQALGVVVVRRVITRSAEAVGEAAHSVSLQQFQALREQGRFALDWQANGLSYGIPVEMDRWLVAGQWVLVNGSRANLPQARSRYPHLLPVLISVSAAVLARRLKDRGRESAEEIEARLARNALVSAGLGADVHYLDNSTSLADAAQRLLDILHEAGLPTQNA